jgi:hypothetical protein
LVASINASVVKTVDELLDHLYADAAGLPSTAGLRRFARHVGARVERRTIIDNDNLYPAVLHANAEMKFMDLISGPGVLDDIAKNLVERDLQLHHCFAGDFPVFANTVERRSHDRNVSHLVAN